MASVSGATRIDLSTIVPRWEWRTFGLHFGRAEAAFAAATPVDVKESSELYLLSGTADNVKVRDDLMDIKVLQETNADGLERWTPVMKAAFPLPAADAIQVLEALRGSVPALDREAYTLDEFVDELVAPTGRIRVVTVQKRRVRYTVGGCMAEVSEVEANRRRIRTIAIEAEDPVAVSAAVRAVGLGGYQNTSYPRGLTALIDDEPVSYAVIDVGTNSVKFHIAQLNPDGSWRTVVDRAEVTRLGEGLPESGTISPEAAERTMVALGSMIEEARRVGVRALVAVGTAGLRIARNGGEVVAMVRKRTGLEVEVISGEEESRLAYLAARAGLRIAAGSVVVFDTGGGSSQFTFGHDNKVDERFSVEVGAVRYTERFGLDGAVSPQTLDAALAAIASDLAVLDRRPALDALVGMGGAITNITAVKHRLAAYDPEVVQGTILERAEIDRQIELYRTREAGVRREIVGLQPKRAEVILAGACIVRTVMDKLGQATLTVSDRGLRHGVLVERFGAVRSTEEKGART